MVICVCFLIVIKVGYLYCQETNIMERGNTIRLATFNLKHGAPYDDYWADPKQVDRACAELSELQPDILALQEVDRGTARSGDLDLDTVVADTLGMEAVFAQTMKFWRGRYGNALLVRGDIVDPEELRLQGGHRFKFKAFGHKLQLPGHEPRSAILATARVRGHEISVAATHLSTEKNLSQKQLPRILRVLGGRPGPHVLMGDFNRTPDEVETELLLGSMERIDSARTFPSPNPRKTIDHIAVNGLRICASEVRQLPISDHLALIADVEVAEV
jgi:endonuclease/exonuclease/phosphatase family metal-dependent hydrolase